MTTPQIETPDIAVELVVADRLMVQILDAARMLSPEGWQRAYYHALLDKKWHTSDVALMKDVRLVSMRGGPRYLPGAERDVI